MLTPVDIETVEFKKVALGYSVDEVNDFLDKVIFEFEILYKENTKLNDKVGVLEEAIKYYKSLEDTIKNSIMLAERAANEVKHNANKSSDQIVREAQIKATEILQDANKKLYELEYEALRMENKYNSFRAKLKFLLESEKEILDGMSEESYDNLKEEAVPSSKNME